MASKAFSLKAFFLGIILILSTPTTASGAWELSSEFKLQLHIGLLDSLIKDFWSSLGRKQTIPLSNIQINDPIPISITGIRANIEYEFSEPQRIERSREWELKSNAISAELHIDNINATQIIEKDIGGIIVRIRLEAECHNIRLSLPQGLSYINTHLRTDINNGQIKISMPFFDANWNEGAWQVQSMTCTGAEGFDQVVANEALKKLSSLHNFNNEIETELSKQLALLSEKSSVLLLAKRELTTDQEYLKISFEPNEVIEGEEDSIEVDGILKFTYPNISKNENISHFFSLTKNDLELIEKDPLKSSRLLLPFHTIRGLIMGGYLSGKLNYSMRSYEIPAFQSLMQSRWKQFFAWPDLMRFRKNTTFLFQFLASGPPSFENPKTGGAGEITGLLTLPLSARMYAPQNSTYVPYAEFQSMLAGNTKLKLLKNGKVKFQINTDKLKINYRWSQKYLEKYEPSEYIAVGLMSDALKDSLNAEGLELTIPSIPIGIQSKLIPNDWKITGETMAIEFEATSGN